MKTVNLASMTVKKRSHKSTQITAVVIENKRKKYTNIELKQYYVINKILQGKKADRELKVKASIYFEENIKPGLIDKGLLMPDSAPDNTEWGTEMDEWQN